MTDRKQITGLPQLDKFKPGDQLIVREQSSGSDKRFPAGSSVNYSFEDLVNAINNSAIYGDTAAGIAGTSDGEYFITPSPVAEEYAILYLNDSNAAVEQSRYPSAQAIATAQADADTALQRSLLQPLMARSLAMNPPISTETLRADFANRAYGLGGAATGLIDELVPFSDMWDFTRASPKWVFNAVGDPVQVPSGEIAYSYDPATGKAMGFRIEEARTRLNTIAAAPTSPENVTVTAAAHTISFFGTGTVDLTGVATETLVGTGADDRVTLTFTPTAGTLTITPSGSVTDVQLEAGSVATSVIRGEGSQVTREADNCSRALGAEFNSAGFTIYVDLEALYEPLPDDGNLGSVVRALYLDDGTTDNRIIVGSTFAPGSVKRFSALVTVGGTSLIIEGGDLWGTGQKKLALSIDAGNVTLCANGEIIGSVANTVGAPTLTTMRLGRGPGGDQSAALSYRDVRILPRTSTSDQLQILTAPDP